jgi:hypothetical protein
MLGIFLFVFCADLNIMSCGKIAGGLNGYWQNTPPAAAVAKTEDDAKNYFNYLNDEIRGGATRTLGTYGEVTGQDYHGGALLTVRGYKVFVASFAFTAVLESHIRALIGNYLIVEERAKSGSLPVIPAAEEKASVITSSETPGSSLAKEVSTETQTNLNPLAKEWAPEAPWSPGTVAAVIEHSNSGAPPALTGNELKTVVPKEEAPSANQKAIKDLGIVAWKSGDIEDLFTRLENFSVEDRDQFTQEWAHHVDRLAANYPAMDTGSRDKLFTVFPIQFYTLPSPPAPPAQKKASPSTKKAPAPVGKKHRG